MAALKSPAGTEVTAAGELAEKLKSMGWVSADAQPMPVEVKRSPGRPKR